MAAMAQLDCGACGYLCQTYSEAIADGAEKRPDHLLARRQGDGQEAQGAGQGRPPAPTATAAANGKPAANGRRANGRRAAPAGSAGKNPFPARLLEVRNLNRPGSDEGHPARRDRPQGQRPDLQGRRRPRRLPRELPRPGRLGRSRPSDASGDEDGHRARRRATSASTRRCSGTTRLGKPTDLMLELLINARHRPRRGRARSGDPDRRRRADRRGRRRARPAPAVPLGPARAGRVRHGPHPAPAAALLDLVLAQGAPRTRST